VPAFILEKIGTELEGKQSITTQPNIFYGVSQEMLSEFE
jgi:hypothetical protein